MPSAFNPYAVPSFLAFAASASLGVYVFYRNPGNAPNKVLSLLAMLCALWSFGEFASRVAQDPSRALLWLRVLNTAVPFLAPAFLQFALLFSVSSRTRLLLGRTALPLLYGLSFLFVFAVWGTDLTVRGAEEAHWGFRDLHGPLFTVQSLYTLILVAAGTALLLRALRRTKDPAKRRSLLWILGGSAIPAAGCLTTNLLLPAVLAGRVFPSATVLVTLAWVFWALAIVRAKVADFTTASASRAIVATLPDALILADATGGIAAVNQAAAEMLGSRQRDLIGKPVTAVLQTAPAGPDRRPAPLDRAPGEETLTNASAACVTRDGRNLPVLVSSSVMRDRRGALQGVVYIVKDVSALRQTEAALQESEEVFQIVSEATLDGVVLTDHQGNISSWNPAAERMFGHRPAEVLGKPIGSLFSREPHGRAAVEELERITRERRGKAAARILEMDAVRRSGETFSVELSHAPVKLQGRWKAAVILRDITARKGTEDALRSGEQKYRSLVENLNDIVYALDDRGVITYISPNIEGISGYRADEIVGKSFLEFVYLEDRPGKMEGFFRILAGSGEKSEYRFLKKTGEAMWIQTTAVQVREDGRVTGLQGVLVDITRRKRMERELEEARSGLERRVQERTSELMSANHQLILQMEKNRKAQDAVHQSEERYRLLADSVTDVIWTMDRNLRFTYCSPSVRTLRGYCPEEALQQGLDEMLSPRSLRETQAVIAREWERFQNGTMKPFTVELELTRKDGSTVWTETTLSMICGEAGEPLHVMGVSRDISERKKSEQRLRESEEKVREMLENINDVVYGLDPEGRVTYASPPLQRVLGHRPEDVTGSLFTDFVHPEDLARCREGLGKVLSGQVQTNEYRLRSASGEYRWFQASGRPMAKEGRVIGERGILRDVDDEKRLQAQLQQAQRMEAIGTLAGGIAHDFNNILTGILGYAELALRDVPEGSLLRSNVEQILGAATRAERLVNQILTFSRREEVEKVPLDMVPVIEEALSLLRVSLPKKVEIRSHFTVPSGTVLGDPTRIHQVLMNLCTNAAHAMRDAGGTIDVRLSTDDTGARGPAGQPNLPPGPYLKLTVEDTGHGMEPEILNRIFDPFFTTKGPGEGTGMGLSVVHGIVRDLGGDIQVDSTPGRGTRFSLFLPAREEAAAPAHVSPDAPPCGKGSVLFVDDDEHVVAFARQVLERMGCQVTAVTRPEAALEIFRDDPDGFDLVITDQNMPGMNGTELARALAGLRGNLPVLLCSGLGQTLKPKELRDAGIRDVLRKPLRTQVLADALHRVLAAGGASRKEPGEAGHILVIDDDPDVRGVLRQTLERDGYRVHEAPNGKVALRRHGDRRFRVIVTDLFMDEMDGIETIVAFRKRQPQAAIIAISGGGKVNDGDYLPQAKLLGAEKAFPKPLDLGQLTAAVRDITGRTGTAAEGPVPAVGDPAP